MCVFNGITSSPRQKGEEKAMNPVPSMIFIATKWRKVVTVSNRWSQNQWTGMASGVGINETGSIEVPLSRRFALRKFSQKVKPTTTIHHVKMLSYSSIILGC